MEYKFSFNVGDLVEFTHGHLGASVQRIGLVVERSLKPTRDDMYKIQSNEKYYWICSTRMEMLSEAAKHVSK
jgi:hypothetical protein